jgi:hypothetical protein
MGRRLTPDDRNNKKKYGEAMLYAGAITIRYKWCKSGADVEFLTLNG